MLSHLLLGDLGAFCDFSGKGSLGACTWLPLDFMFLFPLLILLCILLGTAQLYANPVIDSRKSLNQRGSWGPPDQVLGMEIEGSFACE